jgi:hypothetical protein
LASGATIEGGAGGQGGHISLTASWCDDGGPGGDGLLLGSPSSIAKILGCAFTGGAGGPGGPGGTGCTAGANGLPVDNLGGSFTDLGGAARSFNATSPVRELHDSTFTFEGAPGELAFVLYSPAQSSIYFEPFKGMLLPNLLYADVYTAGTLSPAGELTVTVTVPALPPTIQGGTYFLQSLFFDPSTGALLIGAPSALAILSASL